MPGRPAILALAVLVSAVLCAVGPASARSGEAASSRDAARVGLASASRGETSCAPIVRWRARRYHAVAVKVSPVSGRSLGEGAVPACGSEPATRVPLAALPGALPRNALVMTDRDDVVFVRAALLARGRLPAAVKRLLTVPRCTSSGRVRLVGPWLGISAPGGVTETDLRPPYRLDLHVRSASERRYLRAFLALQVTESTRGLITRADIEQVLWEGGDLAATVRCVRGRYVASALDPRPPQ